MKNFYTYLFAILLSFTIQSQIHAQTNTIPTGFQLQEAAEKKTSIIDTQALKKMLDEELEWFSSIFEPLMKFKI